MLFAMPPRLGLRPIWPPLRFGAILRVLRTPAPRSAYVGGLVCGVVLRLLSSRLVCSVLGFRIPPLVVLLIFTPALVVPLYTSVANVISTILLIFKSYRISRIFLDFFSFLTDNQNTW